MSRFAIIAAAFLLAGPALAQTAQQTTQEDPNEIICRSGEPAIGSHLAGPRTCRTRKEWNDLQQQTEDSISRVQVRSSDANTLPGPGN